MKNTISYKNYIGSVEFDEENCIFFGKVLGVKALLSYEGTTAHALCKSFHEAIDEYLELCKEQSIEPEQPYKGSFNVRIPETLHRTIAGYALANKLSLNKLVVDALKEYVNVHI